MLWLNSNTILELEKKNVKWIRNECWKYSTFFLKMQKNLQNTQMFLFCFFKNTIFIYRMYNDKGNQVEVKGHQ